MKGMNNLLNNHDIKNYIYNPTPLKILSFLSLHPGKIFTAKEISESAHASKGATNQTLRLFLNLDILSREQKGNVFLYKLNHNNIILKQFKMFDNLLTLHFLIKEIQPYCYKIILFGSYANGTNTDESDIDLFVKSENRDEVRHLINKFETVDLKIQAIIQDPLEVASTEKEDKEFFEQVKKGIVLWEGRPTYEEF